MSLLRPRPSITRALPLSMGLLLLAVTALTLATAYHEMRRSARTAATDRLVQVTRQMRDLFQTGLTTQLRTATALANDPLIAPLFGRPSTADTARALDSLRRVAGRMSNLVAVEAWDEQGRLRYRVGRELPLDSARVRQITQPLSVETPGSVSSLHTLNDTVFFTLASVSLQGNQVRGYLVQHRRAAASPNAAAQISALIGSDSKLLLGNRDGSLWTNFVTRQPAPPVMADDSIPAVEYRRDGVDVVAHFSSFPNTPWVIATEVPRTLVFSDANAFLWRGAVLRVLLLLTAIWTAWALSRRISRPLRDVAHAANALAAGERVQPIQVGRWDELQVLANAFNTMAAKVTDHRTQLEAKRDELRALNQELERRVTERTAQLQETNRELEAFSYSVSHDLRAPLRAIDGFSKILEEEHVAELNDDARRLLQVVRRSTQQMGQLIDDLLAFARLGRKSVEQTWVDMTALATMAAEDTRHAGDGRSIALVVHSLPPAVGDRALLRQVFLNLLENAFKFTRTRDPAHIEIGHGEHAGHKVYFVRDNGVGFDPRYADKLFGVFQRLHRADEYEGTGVGLALVQRIVHRHGGHVWAEGAVNEGATIYFSLSAEATPA